MTDPDSTCTCPDIPPHPTEGPYIAVDCPLHYVPLVVEAVRKKDVES